MNKGLTTFKIIGILVALILYFVILNIQISGMNNEIRELLAILSAAIVLWITRPIPIYLTGILIPIIAWATGFVTFEVAFSGFSGTTFWFLFAALGLAGCIRESGVARRVALLLLSRIKPHFSSLMLTLMIIMFVLGYILPLAAARVALMVTIIIPVVTLFDERIRSNIGKAATILVALLGAASAWQVLTGGMPGMLLWGSLGQAGYSISWLNWALIMLMPTSIVFVIMYFVITRMFKPKNCELRIGMEKIKEEVSSLGPIQGIEKRALIILGLIMLLWLTESIHHLGVELVGIVGVFLFVLPIIGTITFEDFMKKAVPWPLLLFVGALMSLFLMASNTGLGSYISETLITPIYSIADNSLTFILATWLLNTVVSAVMLYVPSIPLLIPAIGTAAIAAGVNPVIGGLVYLSCFPQMLFYAAVPFFPIAYDSGTIEPKDWIKAGFFYWLAWPLAHIICIFTWYPLLEYAGLLD
jgi:sodium-dependent dicarboxylate transporter 2/3/5